MKIEDFFTQITKGKSKDLLETFTLSKSSFGTNIDKFENKKGVYAWYLMPAETDSDGLNDYYKIFNNKKFTATFKAKFNEEYFGENIRNTEEDKNKEYIKDKSFSDKQKFAFQLSALFLSPPIYVGVSDDLKERLSTHFEELNIKIGTNFDELQDYYDESNNKESAARFASRICKAVKISDNRNSWTINNFVVKVMVFKDEEMTNPIVQDIEGILNRTFKPTMGKK